MEKRQKQQQQFVNEILANSIENGNNQFAVNLLFSNGLSLKVQNVSF